MPPLARPGDGPLKNRWVSFRIADAYIPSPLDLLMNLHGHDVLQGQVVDLSDNGTDVFVVVEVAGMDQPVVVPAALVVHSSV